MHSSVSYNKKTVSVVFVIERSCLSHFNNTSPNFGDKVSYTVTVSNDGSASVVLYDGDIVLGGGIIDLT